MRERQRTRADREPRQRKAAFPSRPRTPRATRHASLTSRARSFCARLARRRSRGAERTEQERARSRGWGEGSPGRPFPRTRTASSEGARRSDSPRAARVAPCATCTARRARGAHAPGARRSEGEARAKRRNAIGTAEAEPSDKPAREKQTASSEGARRSDSPRAVCVASRVACAARPLVMRAPPPACGRIKGAPRAARKNERRREEKRAPHARHPCSTAAARTTRDARAARTSRAHRPSRCTLARARSTRSDDQREGRRQGRRPATEEEEKHQIARHPA